MVMRLREGVMTSRALLLIFFSLLVIAPINIFTSYSIGSILSGSLLTLLLLYEIGRLTGKPVSKTEAFLVYFMVAYLTSSLTPGLLLFWGWPIQTTFNVDFPLWKSLGISSYASQFWWYAPKIAYNPDAPRVIGFEWLPNVLLQLFGYGLTLMMWISASFIIAALYARKEERMPFPAARVQIETITGLVEPEPTRKRILSIFTVAGIVWGLVIYGFPILSYAFLGISIEPGAMLFRDFTKLVQQHLPGAAFAIAIDLSVIMSGWIMPSKVVVSAFASSLLFFVLGNYIALKLPWDYFKLWQSDYHYGLDIIKTYQYSYADVWFSPFIGITLAAGTLPFILYAKRYYRGLKSLVKSASEARAAGEIPLTWILVMYIGTTAASILVNKLLILPNFPLWPYLAYAAFGFLMTMLFGWGVAETGFGGPGITDVDKVLIWSSGYRELDVFLGGFPPITPGGAPSVLVNNAWIVGEACGVKPMTYIKWMLLLTPIGLLMNYVYTNIIWSIAPIPSNLFYSPSISWPVDALRWTFWPSLITGKLPYAGTINIDFGVILASFIASGAFYVLAELFKLPFSFIGFIIGASPTFYISTSFSWLLGLLIGKVAERRLGKEFWDRYKVTVAAGFGIGTGLMAGFSIALLMIKTSIFASPY
jgi:hypothetical protein